MQANPSKRWKNDILEVVEDHDFGLLNVYDAGATFRQDDHQCDFCGTHLRYTAEIAAEDDQDIEYKVGLDCLEHAMGTSWSHLQDVERKIKELKKEAKRERRKEAFAEEYEKEIQWLEKWMEITGGKSNNFLASMHEVLTEGTKEFSRQMEESLHEIIAEIDLRELKKKEERLDEIIGKLDTLIELIVEVDDLEWDEDRNRYVGQKAGKAYNFVKSVRDFAVDNRRVTDNQLEPMNEIFDRYKKKASDEDEAEEDDEPKAEEDAPKVPF